MGAWQRLTIIFFNRILEPFVVALYNLFVNLHFTYFEINPLGRYYYKAEYKSIFLELKLHKGGSKKRPLFFLFQFFSVYLISKLFHQKVK